MLLRRLGNKSKMAEKLISLMPPHNMYFEPFFGTGSIFFKKPLSKFNYLNDQDSDVYNLFKFVISNRDEIYEKMYNYPFHIDQFKYFRDNFKNLEGLERACAFLYLSNYSFLGMMTIPKFGRSNTKGKILKDIYDESLEKLNFAHFNNKDFRDFFKNYNFRSDCEIEETFIYCDPPYIDTSHNYKKGFKVNDSIDLLDILTSKNWKFMYSEYKNEKTLDLAKQYNLHVTDIKERRNLTSDVRQTEIILTNYDVENISIYKTLNTITKKSLF